MNRVPAIALGPLVIAQALRLRRATKTMPPAAGDRATGTGILVLGDSTAVGVGVTTLDEALPGRLGEALGLGYTVIGASGLTAAEVRERMLADALAVPADIVVLLVGWNDAMRLRWSATVGDDVTAIVRELQAKRIGRRIVIVEPPVFGDFRVIPQPMRWVLGFSANGIRRALRKVGARWGVLVAPGFDGRHVAADRFHPDADGYAHLADSVLRALGERP